MSHITLGQRYTIEVMLQRGYKQIDISRSIGKDKSVISREIKRNCDNRSSNYRSELAQKKYDQRQGNKPKQIKFTEEVRCYVEQKLKEKWSPEQISKTVTQVDLVMVSHERIYQHIIQDKKIKGTLWTNLRRKKKYRKRCVTEDRRGKLANTKNIRDRPPEVDQRSRYGDYEVDLILGANHKGAILTLNDRKTGIVKMRLLKSKNAKMVSKQIVKALKAERGKIHTITSDNGKEFSEHEYISKSLGIEFYFADPYSSWQRGSNENINGLVRQYFPKKTNFGQLSWRDIKYAETQLNNRPRKRYGFKSPKEEFNLLTKVAFAA